MGRNRFVVRRYDDSGRCLVIGSQPDPSYTQTPAPDFKVTFRVMGPHERGRFAPEAWGHLLALSGSGVLNAAEFEHVIERALTVIDGRIALDDLRAMMEGAGLSDDGSAGSHLTVH